MAYCESAGRDCEYVDLLTELQANAAVHALDPDNLETRLIAEAFADEAFELIDKVKVRLSCGENFCEVVGQSVLAVIKDKAQSKFIINRGY